MGRKREPYLLFQRGLRKSGKKTSKTLVYYVQYRNLEGEQISPVSTGEETKTAAHSWAQLNMDRVIKKSYEKKGDPLRKLLADFYSANSTILKRRTDRGERIGETHRRHCESYCSNYFIPFFEDNGIKSIQDVTRPLLRELQDYIREKGNKGKTVNSALSALRQIFSYLMDEEEVKTNPFFGLKQLSEAGEKEERGAFPLEKVKKVFHLSWDEKRDYLLALLGASCGLRNSEINALQAKSIIEQDGLHFLNIKSAFNAESSTKTQAGVRLVPLYPSVFKELADLIKVMGYKSDDYLFWEKMNGHDKVKPLPYKVFGDSVLYAANKMGLTENYLNDNNITFYGWRHFYNSLLVQANINIYKIKIVMGHSLNTGTDMTANYYKSIDKDYSDIIKAISVLFD